MQEIEFKEKSLQVIRLLGKGKGGYSCLVQNAGQLYVLKQIHHEPCAYYHFEDKFGSELRDYARLWELGIPLPRLLDWSKEQEMLLKEYIDGPTMDMLVEQELVEPAYLRQMEAMCRILYQNGLNIDYFPTNFVVRDGRLFYVDYECNSYMEQWDFLHWGIRYWSRTPEFLQWRKEHKG